MSVQPSVSRHAPIGVFDSGVGGLTVVRQLRQLLPNEHIIYFGDTARVPYGTKSEPTVRKYAAEDTALLLRYEPKLIVIACNTVSALALDTVQETANGLGVLGVIKAGAKLAIEKSEHKRIGVIGTQATIASYAYQRELHRLNKDVQVFSKACPLFVPLAEEGFAMHEASKLIAKEYLAELLDSRIDALILGCTHYPLLKPTIQDVVGKSVELIDSAEAVAREVKAYLAQQQWLSDATPQPPRVLVSDMPQRFRTVAERFLGMELGEIELVAL
ncbi:MAG: glutamate racemase [Chloroherpetonaceae bacterium]